jgi:glycosyltransferase involved in cell wall biosynthesis
MAHGLSNVLDAAKLLKDRDDIRFLLAGDGAERASLIVRAENSQLKNVVFLPPQSKEMMPKVWSLCDVALVHLKNSPAFAEVLPSKMFEAMGMGLPVLMALPEGEATEILELDGAGISVLPENPKALADAAQKLCDDKALLKKFQDQSLAAAPLHSREKQAQQMIHVLTAAAEGRGGSVGKSAP